MLHPREKIVNITFLVQLFIEPEIHFKMLNLLTNENITFVNSTNEILEFTSNHMLDIRRTKTNVNKTDYHWFTLVTMEINCRNISFNNSGEYSLIVKNGWKIAEL